MSTTLPHHPLDAPGVLKILIGREASEIIEAHGEQFLAIITHPDSTSPPEATGRLVLHVLPITKERADAAYRVAAGKARAMPIKKPIT